MLAPGYGSIAFGLQWTSDVRLLQFAEAPVAPQPDVTIRRVAMLAPRDPMITIANAALCTDGIRFCTREATFDLYPPGEIEWLPGPGWSGHFPPQFYGTVTALLLAWRGSAPIHGTSVEIDGSAYLICGESGAGKSTLGAALVAAGAARLIADDLSALVSVEGSMPMLYAGRPGIRLFPAIAHHMEQAGLGVARAEPGNDKLVLKAPRVASLDPIPIAATILLGEGGTEVMPWRKDALLRAHRFRPRWMDAIPGREARDRTIRLVAATIPMLCVQSVDIYDAAGFAARADAVLKRIDRLES